MGEIDLHIHSTASEDGQFAPSRICEMAYACGLKVFSITDHDSVSGTAEALDAARKVGIDFVPGVELTTHACDVDVHVLGYFLDWETPELARHLAMVEDARWAQARGRVKKLQALGIPICDEAVADAAEPLPPTTAAFLKVLRASESGRSHPLVAPYINGEKASAPVYNFYVDFFKAGSPAFVNLDVPDALFVIRLIREVGGIPVLAHPGRTPESVAEYLARNGLLGIEVFCTTHTSAQTKWYRDFCARHDLLMTAGTDYHGPEIKPDIELGSVEGPCALYERLLETAERMNCAGLARMREMQGRMCGFEAGK